MKKLKILFANGRTSPPFSVGGDGISLHTWLSQLTKKGCFCLALGVLDPIHFPKKEKYLTKELTKLKVPFKWKANPDRQLLYNIGYSISLVKRKKFLKELVRTIDNFKPDILLTQLEMSPQVLEIGQRKSLPIIFFVHDAEKENFLTIGKIDCIKKNVCVIFNSYFTQSKYKSFLRVPHAVFYPPLRRKDYLASHNTKYFITIINPVREKGGFLFQQIVAGLKNKQFLAVEGWYHPKTVGIELDKYPNLTFWEKQNDMKKVYGRTKILLAPSTWEEGFGRVVLEAALNGIPSIISKIGGLPEAGGNGAIMIENYQSLNEWIKKIKQLDENEDYYKKLSLRAKQHAGKFELEKETDRLLGVLRNIIAKNRNYND